MKSSSDQPPPPETQVSRILSRTIVTRPDRVIQVERIVVTREQEDAVSAALRFGRLCAGLPE